MHSFKTLLFSDFLKLWLATGEMAKSEFVTLKWNFFLTCFLEGSDRLWNINPAFYYFIISFGNFGFSLSQVLQQTDLSDRTWFCCLLQSHLPSLFLCSGANEKRSSSAYKKEKREIWIIQLGQPFRSHLCVFYGIFFSCVFQTLSAHSVHSAVLKMLTLCTLRDSRVRVIYQLSWEQCPSQCRTSINIY
jgi:hypothetical protein